MLAIKKIIYLIIKHFIRSIDLAFILYLFVSRLISKILFWDKDKYFIMFIINEEIIDEYNI